MVQLGFFIQGTLCWFLKHAWNHMYTFDITEGGVIGHSHRNKIPELGTSLFEIALSLFALERTLILGAMALLETKSEAL